MNALTLTRLFSSTSRLVSAVCLACCCYISHRRWTMVLLHWLVSMGFAPHAFAEGDTPRWQFRSAVLRNTRKPLLMSLPAPVASRVGKALLPLALLIGFTLMSAPSASALTAASVQWQSANAYQPQSADSFSTNAPAVYDGSVGDTTTGYSNSSTSCLCVLWYLGSTPVSLSRFQARFVTNYEYNAYYSNDGTTWTQVDQAYGYGTVSADASVPITARYVQFLLLGSGTISFTDTRLYDGSGALVLGPQVPPDPPTALSAQASSGQVAWTWTPPAGRGLTYSIFQGMAPGGETTTPLATGLTTPHFVVTGLTNGTTYYVTVKATNAIGTSAASAEASVIPSTSAQTAASVKYLETYSGVQPASTFTLDAPSVYDKEVGDTATGYTLSYGTLNVLWDMGSSRSIGGYQTQFVAGDQYSDVCYSNDGVTWTDLPAPVCGSMITFPAVMARYVQFYQYEGGSVTDFRLYGPSGARILGPGQSPPIPAAPTGLTIALGDMQLSLSWGASDYATSYTIKRGTASGGPYTTVSTPGMVVRTTYTDTGLGDNATYFYVVSAVNASGEGPNSAQVGGTTLPPPPAPIDPPVSLNAVPGVGQVSLSWAAIGDARTGYHILRATTSGGPYSAIGVASIPHYTDSTATSGIPYFYVVSAYNGNGEGPISDEAMAEPYVSPPPPAITPVYGYDSGGKRTWKTASGVTTYFLYDGSNPVCELDGTGAVTATNTWGGSLLSRHAGMASVFYTSDLQGNVAQRLDDNGNVLGVYAFDAFGLRTGTDSTTDPYCSFGGMNGYYADAESGLLLLGHRYYDTATGRFLTRDPIGYAGGANLYAYCANNPVNLSDPAGTNALSNFYWGGCGGLTNISDKFFFGGSIGNFGTVTGQHDAGCVSAANMAWAGTQVIGNIAINFVPGGGEAKAAEVGIELAVHGAEDVGKDAAADVIKETLSHTGKADFTSVHTLSADEALEAGNRFLEGKYTELGKPGSGTFQSANGERQFRIDEGSLAGRGLSGVSHFHLSIYPPGGKFPIINNHIPIIP